MAEETQTGEILHRDHLRTLETMNTLEQRIMGPGRARPLALDDADDQALLAAIVAMLDEDIDRHFAFEEQVLFPELEKKHAGEVTRALVQEHDAVRTLAAVLRDITERARRQTLDATAWGEFRYAAMDLVPSVLFHIQKEEMTVIRQLRVLLPPEIDTELAKRYNGFEA